MRIALGQDVFAHDGVKVGRVDRLVINDRNNHVDDFVVHKGVVFTSDRLVGRALIDRVDEAGVHLTLDAADERKLPDFVKETYYEWMSAPPYPTFEAMPWGAGGMLLSATPPSPQRGYLPDDGFFDLAPAGPLPGRNDDPLTDDDLVLGEGAGVVSADDHNLGHVHAAIYDDEGTLTALVVRSGLIHRHDVQIPAAWIADIGEFHIHLNVPAAQVAALAAPNS